MCYCNTISRQIDFLQRWYLLKVCLAFYFSAVNEYLSCGYDEISEKCEKRDAIFWENIVIKMLKPVTQPFKCQLGKSCLHTC